ncbi:MAG: hypothetical protein NTV32_00885 [Gammaproteobacteria bacterium]|nr:hypothetical protein [Gammaproteobacteria bacterium]
MHFNIYVNRQLGQQLSEYAGHQGITRNKLIHEVLERYVQETRSIWPSVILQFKGVPDFPAFELSRPELLPSREDPLA